MKWITALTFGAIVGFVLPTALNGGEGVWTDGWTGWGTYRPLPGSPGLLFSIPLALVSAIGLRFLFNWHDR